MTATPQTRPLYRIDLSAPHQIYKNAAKKRLPGVTTILGVLDKAALRPWACGMERAGVVESFRRAYDEHPGGEFSFDELASMASAHFPPLNGRGNPTYFSEVFTSKAADLGTVTHARCEAFLKGVELDEINLAPELVEKSQNGAIRFMDQWQREGLVVVHSELQVVSESMQVGGTADIIARRPDGKLQLRDLKTSKASKYYPYPETYGQTAAYAYMYEENYGEAIEEIVVDRIGKEESDPGETYRVTPEQRAAGMRLFRAAREAYEAHKELGR